MYMTSTLQQKQGELEMRLQWGWNQDPFPRRLLHVKIHQALMIDTRYYGTSRELLPFKI